MKENILNTIFRCLLCYEQSKTHQAMNRAVFDTAMGFIKCMAKMGIPLDQPGGDQNDDNGDN